MQHLPPRRIAAIHDFSCVGRCALTVVIPTLSVMGYQTIPLPTALLSSHTGGFENLYFRDLTDDMPNIQAHWQKENITFDAIYTGYLGSEKQIDYVKNIFDNLFFIWEVNENITNKKLLYEFDNLPMTFYSKYGDVIGNVFVLLGIITICLIVLLAFRRNFNH